MVQGLDAESLLKALSAGAAKTTDLQQPMGPNRLVFRAMIMAERSKCECESCKALRAALSVAIGETEGGEQANAPSHSPPAPSVPATPPAGGAD